MTKRLVIWLLALSLPGVAFAQLSYTTSGGTVTNTGTALMGSSTVVAACSNNSCNVGNVGTMSFLTGSLASGSFLDGGTYSGGGFVQFFGNGFPNFAGTFSGTITWNVVTLSNGSKSYTLTGAVTDGTYAGALTLLVTGFAPRWGGTYVSQGTVIVTGNNPGGFEFKAIVAGGLGITQPSWPQVVGATQTEGLIWENEFGVSFDWHPLTSYTFPDTIIPSQNNPGQYMFRALGTGVSGSGSATPVWPQTPNVVITDGSVFWANIGVPTDWEASHLYNLNDIILPILGNPGNIMFQVKVAGYSGPTEPGNPPSGPGWPQVPAVTVTEGPTWLNIGPTLGVFEIASGDTTLGSVTPVGVCSVPDLDPITDSSALQFEAAAPTPPNQSLHYNEVSLTVDNDGLGFETQSGYRRTSGFRPFAYQAHFYNIRRVALAYDNAVNNDPTQVAACANLLTTLQAEIAKHGFATGGETPIAVPKVNRPGQSTHTTLPATALDFNTLSLNPSQLAIADRIASSNGLFRPCRGSNGHPGDNVHFQLLGTSCPQGISGTALSPINILMTDPQGRRVGFDSTSGLVINEIGPDALYTGPGTEPQVIDIGTAIPGNYTLTGVGVGTGPYTLMLERHDEDATTLSSQVVSGTIVPGQIVQTSQTVRQTVNIAILKKIELNDDGSIPVAILSSPTFAASTVQASSLTFGATGTETTAKKCVSQDVNADNLLDLVCSFDQRKAKFTSSSTEGIINGTLANGTPITGANVITFDH